MIRTTPKYVKDGGEKIRLTKSTRLTGLSKHEEGMIRDFATLPSAKR